MIDPKKPALVLAPMEGVTDAPMRALMGEFGAFSYCVSEFLRVSHDPIPRKVFLRDVPELRSGARTTSGLAVQIQILGGDPDRMAQSALTAVRAGAPAIDINFGCPAPTVNRNDGGATLLQYPTRIRDIVSAVRDAVPAEVPVSAKLRLGWDSIEQIHENASMAAEGGAQWLTIHARTRKQGYMPPVFWKPIGQVLRSLDIPVIANGDIWSLDDFRKCQDDTGAIHYMIGRGALADPGLPGLIAHELGLADSKTWVWDGDWERLLRRFLSHSAQHDIRVSTHSVMRLKQWMKLAAKFGGFERFDEIKLAANVDEFFVLLGGNRLAREAASVACLFRD